MSDQTQERPTCLAAQDAGNRAHDHTMLLLQFEATNGEIMRLRHELDGARSHIAELEAKLKPASG